MKDSEWIIATLGGILVLVIGLGITMTPDWDAIEAACAPVCMVDGVQHDWVRARSSEEQCVCDMQRFVGRP